MVDDAFLKDLANIGCIEYSPSHSPSFLPIAISSEEARLISVGNVYQAKSVLYVSGKWESDVPLSLGRAKWKEDGRKLSGLWWEMKHRHSIENSVEVKDYLNTIQRRLSSTEEEWSPLNVHRITQRRQYANPT